LDHSPEGLFCQPGLVVEQAENSGRIDVEEAEAEGREGEGEGGGAATGGHRAHRGAEVAEQLWDQKWVYSVGFWRYNRYMVCSASFCSAFCVFFSFFFFLGQRSGLK